MADNKAKQVHVEKVSGKTDVYNNVTEWVVYEDGRLAIMRSIGIGRSGEVTFATYASGQWVRVWNDNAT